MGVVAALKSIVRKNSTGSDFIRRRINLIEGANVTLTISDDATDDEIDVTIAAAGGGSGSAHTIKESGTPLTARTGLNFQAGLIAADDAGNDETDVDLDYGGAAELADVATSEAAGSSSRVARADHVHAHGALAGPASAHRHSDLASIGANDHHNRAHDHSAAGDAVDLAPASLVISAGPLATQGDISPSQITADQNDYNPTGLATAVVLRLSSDATRHITGLQGGADGRVLTVHNVGGFAIVLDDASASSSAANRFALSASLTLAPDDACVLQYDATSSRWRVLGSSVQGSGGSISDQSVTSRLVDLTVGSATVDTAETTSSATYTDLTTSGPAVTLSSGVTQDHLLIVSAVLTAGTANAWASVAIAGATALDTDGGVNRATTRCSAAKQVLAAAQSSGATHTMKYRSEGGTMTAQNRRIVGVAL